MATRRVLGRLGILCMVVTLVVYFSPIAAFAQGQAGAVANATGSAEKGTRTAAGADPAGEGGAGGLSATTTMAIVAAALIAGVLALAGSGGGEETTTAHH
jgi:hypothetical protein